MASPGCSFILTYLFPFKDSSQFIVILCFLFYVFTSLASAFLASVELYEIREIRRHLTYLRELESPDQFVEAEGSFVITEQQDGATAPTSESSPSEPFSLCSKSCSSDSLEPENEAAVITQAYNPALRWQRRQRLRSKGSLDYTAGFYLKNLGTIPLVYTIVGRGHPKAHTEIACLKYSPAVFF